MTMTVRPILSTLCLNVSFHQSNSLGTEDSWLQTNTSIQKNHDCARSAPWRSSSHFLRALKRSVILQSHAWLTKIFARPTNRASLRLKNSEYATRKELVDGLINCSQTSSTERPSMLFSLVNCSKASHETPSSGTSDGAQPDFDRHRGEAEEDIWVGDKAISIAIWNWKMQCNALSHKSAAVCSIKWHVWRRKGNWNAKFTVTGGRCPVPKPECRAHVAASSCSGGRKRRPLCSSSPIAFNWIPQGKLGDLAQRVAAIQ